MKSCKKFNEAAQTANFTDFSLISCGNWKWSIMDQNYANANAFFSVSKKFLSYPGYAI